MSSRAASARVSLYIKTGLTPIAALEVQGIDEGWPQIDSHGESREEKRSKTSGTATASVSQSCLL
jgi:hypothetical protein